ncbi:MAG: SOS response-associated peptidase [Acidobacteriia bacterium]|nr:SOS response-associated peptidase [Terriglobia bacterium]
MCGRYRLTAKERYLRDHFGIEDELEWAPRYNIAPSQPVLAVRQNPSEPKRSFSLLRWGLIPYWAKDPAIGFKTVNAMSETAAEKPAFREAMRKSRCLLPADGFYEWQKLAKSKQPYNIGMADGSVFAFAGLWDRWRSPAGDLLETCTVLTTDSNALVREIHDRMPVILRPGDYDLWLDPGVTDPARVARLLQPFDARLMKKYPVSTRVNNVKYDDPECAAEIVLAPAQRMTLFD